MHGAATITLTPDGAECVRRFDGDFVVKVPLMGGTIEKRLLPGILAVSTSKPTRSRIGSGPAGAGDAPARS